MRIGPIPTINKCFLIHTIEWDRRGHLGLDTVITTYLISASVSLLENPKIKHKSYGLLYVKLTFGFFAYTQQWMHHVKKHNKTILSKTWREPKAVIFSKLQAVHTLPTNYIPLCLINTAYFGWRKCVMAC